MISFPGDFIAHGEEWEGGENTYVDNDDIFSAVFGEVKKSSRTVSVSPRRHIVLPHKGLEVYAIVVSSNPTKALLYCLPKKAVDENKNAVGFFSAIEERGAGTPYIKKVFKPGDIVFAKVAVITREGSFLTILPPPYGFKIVFCPKCKTKMARKGNKFICVCGFVEVKKAAKG